MNKVKCTIHSNGTKAWWLNGELHREGGPAIIHSNGTKGWYLRGEYHREDGPARMFPNGEKEWWLNGKQLSFEEWCNEVNLSKKRLVELKMCYE